MLSYQRVSIHKPTPKHSGKNTSKLHRPWETFWVSLDPGFPEPWVQVMWESITNSSHFLEVSKNYHPIIIWVNYHISLTWILRPVGDDFPNINHDLPRLLYIIITIINWLVVSTILKNMSSSVRVIIPNIWKVIKIPWFQTTNQIIIIINHH